MKTIEFNRKDYKSYKDFYEDIAIKTGAVDVDDYFDSKTLEYSANILWEVLSCDFGYSKNCIKVILKNFNVEKLQPTKNYDDYKFNIIISVFQDWVKEFPNNILEFVDEE